MERNGILQLLPVGGNGLRLAQTQVIGPLLPRLPLELLFQGHEQGVILKPIPLVLDKLMKRTVGHTQESLICLIQNRPAVFV